MATYDSFSAPDKAVIQNTVNLLRASVGEVFRAFNRIKAIADDTNAVGLVSSIDANEVIPNTSGLAGADDMTRTEVAALYTLLTGIRTTNDTSQNRAAASKASGINALLG